MANQYVNKVIVNNEIKMDLTEDTITPNTLRKGFTAHDASGAPIVGNESLTDISEDGTNAGPILELSADGWAEQDTISGKNLLPNTASGTQTINGVTFTVNPDKSVTCTGTATADALFDLATPNTILGELPANASYCCYGVPKGYDANCRLYIRTTTDVNNLTGGSSSILQNGLANVMMVNAIEYINRVYIKIANGTTVDIVISPQLELGTMPTSYEPYCGGMPSPNPEYPQEIKVARGRNLLQGTISNANVSDTSGVIGESSNYYLAYGRVSAGRTYVASDYNSSTTKTIVYGFFSSLPIMGSATYNGTRVVDENGSPFVAPIDGYVAIRVMKNAAKPQLELGSVATPYVPYGYVGMEVQGRNLAPEFENGGINWSTGQNAQSNVSTRIRTVGYVEVAENTTYTLSIEDGYKVAIRMYAANGTDIGNEGNDTFKPTYPYTFTTPSGVSRLRLLVGYTGDGSITVSDMGWIQLEAGSTAHAYEPYYHSTIPIPLPQKGFVAALPDDTKDILKLDGAGGYEWVSQTDEMVFDGSSDEGWNYFTTNGINVLHSAVIDGPDYSKKTVANIAYCDFYRNVAYSAIAISENNVFGIGYANNTLTNANRRISFINDFTNASDWTTWLSTHPTTVLYPLAKPTTERGYVNEWNNDFPLGCTIDIPELRNTNVEYFLYDSITQLADDYYDRTHTELTEGLSTASNQATLEALAAIAPIENDISSANYAVGSYLIHNNQLCKVTVAIATNETITEGSNVTPITLSDDVEYLIDHPYILPTMSESTKGGAKIGYGLNVENDILSVGGVDDPNDAGPIVKLNANGWAEQFSTTGKNLAKPNSDIKDGTTNGITYTYLGGGRWKVVGTNSSSSSASTRSFKMYDIGVLPSGTYTITMEMQSGTCDKSLIPRMGTTPDATYYGDFTTVSSNSSKTVRTFAADGLTQFWACLQFNASCTVDGIFTIQLEAGSEATEYEPYTGGAPSPSPSYPQEIKVCRGRNLLPNTYSTTTNNGITFTVNADWSVTANGTVSGDYATLVLLNTAGMQDLPIIGQTATLTLSGCPSGGDSSTYQIVANFRDGETAANIADKGLGITRTFMNVQRPSTGNIYIRIYGSGRMVSNLTFYPQLEEGSVATPYVPYGHVGVDVKIDLLQGITLNTPKVINVSGEYINSGYTNYASENYIPCGHVRGLDFTLSSRPKGAGPAIAFYDKTKAFISSITNNSVTEGTPWTFTIPNNADYIRVTAYNTANPTLIHTFNSIPIPLPERGYVASLPDGTCDTLTIDGAGSFTWELITGETVFDGASDENWNLGGDNSATGGGYYICNNVPTAKGVITYSNGSSINGYCDKLAARYMGASTQNTGTGWVSGSASGVSLRVRYQDEETQDLAAFKSWLASNPLTFLFPLATPQTESGYIDYDNTIPVHATISSADLEGIEIRCVADAGAAEISAAWGKRIENELNSLREIVNTLLDNS